MSENQTVLTDDMKFLVKELYEQVFGRFENIVSIPESEEISANPYKGMGKNSISFLNALRKEYRGLEIKLTDKTFQKMRFEYKIVALSYFIDSLKERGLCDVVDNSGSGKSRRIISFSLKK